ncbi:MAG TPA: type II toxin-antitoxin system VapC family toxin [Amycolatopsis sp.]|nr:type II toxin-antitoxin system VapC family toxin [Amycolatopsis sp.]
MIAYFDASALVPLLIREPGTSRAQRLWNAADARVSSRLGYVEAAAALARRADRLAGAPAHQRQDAMELLDRVWDGLDVVNVVEALVREAAGIARQWGLGAHDAMHCASARHFAGEEVVVVSGSRDLLVACRGLGMATAALC